MLTTCKKELKSPAFLEELRSNGGFVLKACKAVGISKQTAYNWRDSDIEFREEWDTAIELATEDLEKECRRRAYEGVLEPVFYQGEEVGTVRRFSDVLLIFQLKALNARYRDKLTVDVNRIDADIERELAIIRSRSQVAAAGEATSESVN